METTSPHDAEEWKVLTLLCVFKLQMGWFLGLGRAQRLSDFPSQVPSFSGSLQAM
jgi:hypothetical protein